MVFIWGYGVVSVHFEVFNWAVVLGELILWWHSSSSVDIRLGSMIYPFSYLGTIMILPLSNLTCQCF